MCAVFGLSCTIPPNERNKDTENQVCKTCGLWFHVACKHAIINSRCESENECGCAQHQARFFSLNIFIAYFHLLQHHNSSDAVDQEFVQSSSPRPTRVSPRCAFYVILLKRNKIFTSSDSELMNYLSNSSFRTLYDEARAQMSLAPRFLIIDFFQIISRTGCISCSGARRSCCGALIQSPATKRSDQVR